VVLRGERTKDYTVYSLRSPGYGPQLSRRNEPGLETVDCRQETCRQGRTKH